MDINQLISIIVPVYNAKETIERCILALVGQSHKNIEIILVNDGSKDNSLEICKQFAVKDKRIKVIDKKNGGVSSARNAGLNIAQGEFIMFCDSDDWAEPEWCEELLSHYKEGNLVICGHYIEGIQTILPYEICAEIEEEYGKEEFWQLRLKFFNCPWNKFYSKKVIDDYGLRFNEKIDIGEDYLFNLQYINCIKGNIIRLSKCVFHYTWPTEESLSNSVSTDYFEKLELLFNLVNKEWERMERIGEKELNLLYTDFFNQFQKGILQELGKNTSLGVKLKNVDLVMRTKEYRKCVEKSYISSNKIYSNLWRCKSGVGLWLWTLIVKKYGRR